MRLVPPGELSAAAAGVGFELASEKTITLQSGKQVALQVFRLAGSSM